MDRPPTMKKITIEYYFSRTAFALGTILILALAFIMSYLSYTTYLEPSSYNDNKFLAALFLLVLIFILVATARRSYTIATSLIANRPALVLTSESLTDNLNRKTFKWSDISEITEKFHYSGKTSGRFITISLKNSDKKFRLQDGGIKCKRQELLKTLIEYHNSSK